MQVAGQDASSPPEGAALDTRAGRWILAVTVPGSGVALGGALGDRYGRRRIFTIGAGVFTVSTDFTCAVGGPPLRPALEPPPIARRS